VNDFAIRTEGLGKQYRIGAEKVAYETIRDTVANAFKTPFRRARRLLRGEATGAADLDETIWALRNIDLEVPRGEVLGIVGRNGAGKSTLLKVLSRITEPTEGVAEIYGRIGSLLEVGTGFHPELTGRENVFLNGAILGMEREEIRRKFDEIVAFAEVAKFIDTPVKFYSSGMRVRLAFAVAAHLEPEILLIDEVLSVGDAAFQKKSLGKMEGVAAEGRTVLFVSHNMGAVENLCTSAIWIEDGQIAARGNVGDVVGEYLKSTMNLQGTRLRSNRSRGVEGVSIREARIFDADGNPCDTFRMGERIVVEYDIEVDRRFPAPVFAAEVKRLDTGVTVLHMVSEDCGLAPISLEPGFKTVRLEIPECMLYPASYNFTFFVGASGGRVYLDALNEAAPFTMVQSGVTQRTKPLSNHRTAVFYVPSRWEIDESRAPVRIARSG
jgi:lipopolysaccharide transport system ATP-binding protein